MPPRVSPYPLPALARSFSTLAGVGPATAKALAAREIFTLGDGLFLFPRRYEDRRRPAPLADLTPGERAMTEGELVESGPTGRGGRVWRMLLARGDARLALIWFRFKKPFLQGFQIGERLIAVGSVDTGPRGGLQMAHPNLFREQDLAKGHPSLGRIVPIYPELAEVPASRLQKVMAVLAQQVCQQVPDPLFDLLPAGLQPLPVGQALATAHLPGADQEPEELVRPGSDWRRSLAANELAYYELALALRQKRRQSTPAPRLAPAGEFLERFLTSLPFSLTPGQKSALEAIKGDLAGARPMLRLLAGDVGTGKTVVAAAAAALAAEAGAQTALMAPTEVLARQHHANLCRYFRPLGVEPILALGSMANQERELAAARLAGGAPLVVGTHALLNAAFRFSRLGLVIIDEQHRFGVRQRLGLSQKGDSPHQLVLSATPIPRTLALAVSGFLEISDLPQRPGGAPRVATSLVPHAQRRAAVEAIAQTLDKGEQVFVICPLVEESENLDLPDAVSTHRRLAAYFPRHRVGLLTGRMAGPEQQRALDEFRQGETPLLVATTVVEVGVDVPRATLMVVLGAERFGLSQLHQLRGRVGRGEKPGRCLLVPWPEPGEIALARLEVLCQSSDGMAIAEADLHFRGPGEAMGLRQAGLPPFRVARWDLDHDLVEPLRRVISDWLARDPDLAGPGLAPVKAEALRRFGGQVGLEED